MQKLEDVMELLREGGFRITPQRVAIVEHIIKADEHPSADCIHKAVKKIYPMIGLSTVYKTLEMLKEKKLVSEIDVDGQARFDSHTKDHINMVCMKCGRIDDVDEKSIKRIQTRAARKSGYQIVRNSFEMIGYCAKCKS